MLERTVQIARGGPRPRRLSEEVPTRSTRPPHGRLPKTRPGSKRPARRLPPEVLSDAEVCALMRACGRHAPTGLRNRALIALLYRAGLRINEALSLYPKDLDLTDGCIRVLNGKGGRSRTVGLNPGAAAIIERWLDVRSRLGLGGRHPVFCTLRGHPMAAAYVRVMLKRLAARAGIDKRVHARGLRHTHAAIREAHKKHKANGTLADWESLEALAGEVPPVELAISHNAAR